MCACACACVCECVCACVYVNACACVCECLCVCVDNAASEMEIVENTYLYMVFFNFCFIEYELLNINLTLIYNKCWCRAKMSLFINHKKI